MKTICSASDEHQRPGAAEGGADNRDVPRTGGVRSPAPARSTTADGRASTRSTNCSRTRLAPFPETAAEVRPPSPEHDLRQREAEHGRGQAVDGSGTGPVLDVVDDLAEQPRRGEPCRGRQAVDEHGPGKCAPVRTEEPEHGASRLGRLGHRQVDAVKREELVMSAVRAGGEGGCGLVGELVAAGDQRAIARVGDEELVVRARRHEQAVLEQVTRSAWARSRGDDDVTTVVWPARAAHPFGYHRLGVGVER